MSDSISDISLRIGQKLKALRKLLLLNYFDLQNATGVSRFTIVRIALILFYGYTLTDFFDFSVSLPNEQQLLAQIISYHKRQKSNSCEILNKQPDLIDLPEHKLLLTNLFTNWVTDKDVFAFCKEKYGYVYSSIPNTLDLAAKKGFLKLEEGSRPKRYRRQNDITSKLK